MGAIPISTKKWSIEFPFAKPYPKGTKSTHFLNEWWLGMRNRSHATHYAETNVVKTRWSSTNVGQTRTNGQKTFSAHLVRLARNQLELCGETVNSDLYYRQLDRSKLAIDQERPKLANRRGLVFHQDNVKPLMSIMNGAKH